MLANIHSSSELLGAGTLFVAGPCGAQQAKHKASLHIPSLLPSLLREADREAVSMFDLVHLPGMS